MGALTFGILHLTADCSSPNKVVELPTLFIKFVFENLRSSKFYPSWTDGFVGLLGSLYLLFVLASLFGKVVRTKKFGNLLAGGSDCFLGQTRRICNTSYYICT